MATFSTRDKARLIHAVGLLQLLQDELRENPQARSVANIIGRLLGEAPDLGADAQSAAQLVRRFLAKRTPEQACKAVVALVQRVREACERADLPGDLAARASQLAGMADAAAKLALANATIAGRQAADRSMRAPSPEDRDRAPVRTATPSRWGAMFNNPWLVAAGVAFGTYALTRKG